MLQGFGLPHDIWYPAWVLPAWDLVPPDTYTCRVRKKYNNYCDCQLGDIYDRLHASYETIFLRRLRLKRALRLYVIHNRHT